MKTKPWGLSGDLSLFMTVKGRYCPLLLLLPGKGIRYLYHCYRDRLSEGY
jgi:hypothetical protein